MTGWGWLDRLICFILCGDAGVRLDPNTHSYKCKKCGCDHGALQ